MWQAFAIPRGDFCNATAKPNISSETWLVLRRYKAEAQNYLFESDSDLWHLNDLTHAEASSACGSVKRRTL